MKDYEVDYFLNILRTYKEYLINHYRFKTGLLLVRLTKGQYYTYYPCTCIKTQSNTLFLSTKSISPTIHSIHQSETDWAIMSGKYMYTTGLKITTKQFHMQRQINVIKFYIWCFTFYLAVTILLLNKLYDVFLSSLEVSAWRQNAMV